jgi:hypothetical protein
MSFNVKAYMNDLDREIVEHRQEIAKLRLRISELEDTRLMLMQREEYRAGRAGEASPFGMLPGGGEIAVRERRLMLMDEGLLSHAAKTGELPPPGLNKSGDRRGMNQRGKPRPGRINKGRHSKDTAVGDMRRRILGVLGDHDYEPMTGGELGNYLGLPADPEVRKPLQNALYAMRVRGQLHRDADKRYSLPRLAPAPEKQVAMQQ